MRERDGRAGADGAPSGRGTTGEVPQLGLRDLRRARVDLYEKLEAKGLPGPERRSVVGELNRDVLRRHWEDVEGPETGAALAAVGGLSRGDSGPESDLDLVLLHDGASLSGDDLAAFASRLWYPIWDAGLELDHSVRTVKACRTVAADDLSAAVGMLDLGFVAGDEDLVQATRSAILQDWRAHARHRIPELLDTSRERRARFGELAHLIEPNLKEAGGGLRDVVDLAAITASWLVDRPHGDVDLAAARLLDVRDALHLQAGRARSILDRHTARGVAARLGLGSADELLSDLADAGRRVAYALDLTAYNARRIISRSGRGRAIVARLRHEPPRHPVAAAGLIEVDSSLALKPGTDPSVDAGLPIRAAAVAVSRGLRPTPGLLEALSRAPDLPEPWPAEVLDDFMRLLRSPESLGTVWEAFDLAGHVVRWIPEWADVRNRPQRNPVHRFTVDRHLVETVIEAGRRVESAPLPDLLLLSALFHDIGKRKGTRDHSATGAALIPPIARRMGLEKGLARDLKVFVRHHLLLAELATRENPESAETARTLLEPLGHRRDLLDTLRVLTEADAIAAGPKAWKPWRVKLVGILTATARSVLETPAR